MANIGVVLAGGFAKGAYQIGILKAIQEYFTRDQVKCISASSIGGLNGYAFMMDKLDVAEEMWLSANFKSAREFAARYLRSSYFADTVEALVGDSGNPNSNLYITCFNCSKLKLDYVNLRNVRRDTLKDYLRASVTLPMFSHAVDIDGKKYVDGGLVDNIPVKPLMPLMKKNAIDYAIIIHFGNDNFIFENSAFDDKLIRINFLDEKIVKNSLAFDPESIAQMIHAGYEESKSLFDIIFSEGTDDLAAVYKKIHFVNGLKRNRKLRLTGDVVMGNINKVLKKIFSRNIVPVKESITNKR